jgi:hypothetical protein
MSEAGGVGRPASYAPVPPNLGDRDPHPAQFAPATSAEPVGVPRVGLCPVTRGDGWAKSTRMMWIESRRQPGRSSPGDADVERAVNVDFELRYAAAQRGERAQNDEFAGRGRQTGPGVDVAKGPGGDLAAEFGRDVCKGIGDLLPGLAIDLLQHPQPMGNWTGARRQPARELSSPGSLLAGRCFRDSPDRSASLWRTGRETVPRTASRAGRPHPWQRWSFSSPEARTR